MPLWIAGNFLTDKPVLLVVIKSNVSPLVMGKMINYMKKYYTEPGKIVPEKDQDDESD